jgi:hypothetical protein
MPDQYHVLELTCPSCYRPFRMATDPDRFPHRGMCPGCGLGVVRETRYVSRFDPPEPRLRGIQAGDMIGLDSGGHLVALDPVDPEPTLTPEILRRAIDILSSYPQGLNVVARLRGVAGGPTFKDEPDQ